MSLMSFCSVIVSRFPCSFSLRQSEHCSEVFDCKKCKTSLKNTILAIEYSTKFGRQVAGAPTMAACRCH